MKNILLIALFPLYQLLAQPTPASLKPEISVSFYRQLGNHAARLVYSQSDNSFIYATTEGNIYRVPIVGGVPQFEVPIISNSEHDINFLQGMVLVGNDLIIVGNHNNQVVKNGYGAVRKCTFLSNGSKQWTNMLTTDIYASSGTLFDHAFAGVCTNLPKDSLFIASGSRTDRGEVKDFGGLYPNLREEPLTTKIFRISINAQNIYLQNNETALTNSGYVYATGFRNEFDMAVNQYGHLFGVENSGGSDFPEEMNWIRQGKHYGFPWRMGGLDVLSVYPDPNFPTPPAGVNFVEPISNYGTAANWQRTPSGTSQLNGIKSFTAHRSPLGLIFDNEGDFNAPYNKDGFCLAFAGVGNSNGPPEDPMGDFCHLEMSFVNGNYQMNVTRLVEGFYWAVDAEKVGRDVYVLEYFGKIWKITMPESQAPIANFSTSQQTDCLRRFNFQDLSDNSPTSYFWEFGDGSTSTQANPTHLFANIGNYNTKLTVSNSKGSNFITIPITISSNYNVNSVMNSQTRKFQGVESITANSMILGSSNINFRGTKYILLSPNFTVNQGNVFKAEIGNCEN
jgi:hypothetical protein